MNTEELKKYMGKEKPIVLQMFLAQLATEDIMPKITECKVNWWIHFKRVDVEFRPNRGFGICFQHGNVEYGEGVDEIIKFPDDAAKRVMELLNK